MFIRIKVVYIIQILDKKYDTVTIMKIKLKIISIINIYSFPEFTQRCTNVFCKIIVS